MNELAAYRAVSVVLDGAIILALVVGTAAAFGIPLLCCAKALEFIGSMAWNLLTQP